MKRIKKPSKQITGMKTRLCAECRAERIRNGYTQAYIAKIAGVDCSVVSRFESGQCPTLWLFLAYVLAMPEVPWYEIIEIINALGVQNESETGS